MFGRVNWQKSCLLVMNMHASGNPDPRALDRLNAVIRAFRDHKRPIVFVRMAPVYTIHPALDYHAGDLTVDNDAVLGMEVVGGGITGLLENATGDRQYGCTFYSAGFGQLAIEAAARWAAAKDGRDHPVIADACTPQYVGPRKIIASEKFLS